MNSNLRIYIFNVGAGQSILVYPSEQSDHAMFIDCGGEVDSFSPVNFLTSNDLLPRPDGKISHLGCFALTNYDHDHFSFLPELREKLYIGAVLLPDNISSKELKEHKPDMTKALEYLCHMKNTYIYPAEYFKPVYGVGFYCLRQEEFGCDINTNNLSQIIFIEGYGSKICISGDLEKAAWEKLLKKKDIQDNLKSTNVFVAPHHGRESGYHDGIFDYCIPDVVIISDKEIMYDTQDGMAKKYAGDKVKGIAFNGAVRKVLTTRNEGHILLEFSGNGNRMYSKFSTD